MKQLTLQHGIALTLAMLASAQTSEGQALQRAGGISRDTNLLGVYAYRISIGENRFDIGAAIAIVMMLITLLLTITYLRSMVRQDELS